MRSAWNFSRQVKCSEAVGRVRAPRGRILPATWLRACPMGKLDVSPASSPWQRAGDYFRCCEGSGLTRVSVPLSHAVRAAAAAAALPLSRPVRSLGHPLRGREGAARRMPTAWGGAEGADPGRPSTPRSRVAPVPVPFSALAPAWQSHSLSGEGTVCVRAVLAVLHSLCSRGLRGSRVGGLQRPEGVRPRPAWPAGAKTAPRCYSGLVRVSQDISIYCSGRGGGKNREDGEGAAGEEGGKQELEVPWK